MGTSEKVGLGVFILFGLFFALLIVGAIIGPSWSEIIVTYNCDDPDAATYIIATMPDGKMKDLYLPVARGMGMENGDELCLLVKRAAIFGFKTYTVAENCQ